jgi:hemolysin activation/secretion protein
MGQMDSQIMDIPGSTEPGRLPQRFPPPSLPLPEDPPIQIEPDRPLIPEEAETVEFHLQHLSIEGNTVFSTEELRVFWEDVLGQKISLADLYGIAAAMTNHYRGSGYILSRVIVPAQRISEGQVVLRVLEGYIHRVIIEGEIGGSEKVLEGFARKLSSVRPLTSEDLERYLLLMQDLPGVTLESVLRPSADQPGASDLTIVLHHKSLDVWGEINNRSNDFIGPVQALAGVQFNSLLGAYEQTGLRVASTPVSFEELVFFDVNMNKMIGSEGTRVSLTGTFIWSEPESREILEGLGVESDSQGFELMMTHPLLRSRNSSLWVSTSFFFQNSSTDLFHGKSKLTRDRIRVFRVDGTYDLIDRFRGINRAVLGLHQGVNIFNATESGSNHLSRINGQSDFTALTGTFSRLQPIGLGWSGLVSVIGQYAFDSLLVPSQFGIGGAQYVRGYDPSERLGDSGIAAKAELQLTQNPGLSFLQTYQAYTYYDFGAVWNRNGFPGFDSDVHLDSVGVGVRVNAMNYLSGYLEVAKPLAGAVAARGGDANAPRVFFSVTASY